jgi:hypothetical protein
MSSTVIAYAGLVDAAAAEESAPKSAPELLRRLVAVEQLLISVYRHVIATDLLSVRVGRTAQRVLAQERVHAAIVHRELRKLGGTAAAAITGTDALDKALASLKVSGSLKKLHSEHDCVHLLLELEMAAQGVYFKAISQLHDVRLAHLAAQILASEAQHQTAVSEARRPGNSAQAVPRAFVKD